MVNEPEYESIETFAEYLIDDDREEFFVVDVTKLRVNLRLSSQKVISALEGYGFTYTGPEKVRHTRGFTTNNHDRWYGPGASKTHGGSGVDPQSGILGWGSGKKLHGVK